MRRACSIAIVLVMALVIPAWSQVESRPATTKSNSKIKTGLLIKVPVRTEDGRSGQAVLQLDRQVDGTANGRIEMILRSRKENSNLRTEYRISKATVQQFNQSDHIFLEGSASVQGSAAPSVSQFSAQLSVPRGARLSTTASQWWSPSGIQAEDDWEAPVAVMADGDIWRIEGLLTCKMRNKELVCRTDSAGKTQ